jgi:hypothetical protein
MIRFFAADVIATLSAAPAMRGDLTLRGGQGSWQPTECRMPVATAGAYADAQALNAAQSALVQAVDQYNLCLRNEAQRDMQRANQIVIDRVGQLQSEAMAMAQNFPRR